MNWMICIVLLTFIVVIFLACAVMEIVKIRKTLESYADRLPPAERSGPGKK